MGQPRNHANSPVWPPTRPGAPVRQNREPLQEPLQWARGEFRKSFVLYGVGGGIRTLGHRNHNPALYQLSYTHHEGTLQSYQAVGTTRKFPTHPKAKAVNGRSSLFGGNAQGRELFCQAFSGFVSPSPGPLRTRLRLNESSFTPRKAISSTIITCTSGVRMAIARPVTRRCSARMPRRR